MRIVHYYADGAVHCGVMDSQGRLRGFAGHAELQRLPARQCLETLLTMEPAQRDELDQRLQERAPVVIEQPRRLAPAVPDPPLYFYMHGNAPTIWKRQSDRFWEISRVPHGRIRPWSCLSGYGTTVEMPAEARISTGTEFTVVLGRPARSVRLRDAAAHIAGIVGTNDGFLSGVHAGFDTNVPGVPANTVHTQSIHTLCKASDSMGGLGPCIVTIEEAQRDFVRRAGTDRLDAMRSASGHLAFLYDLLTRNYRDGQCVDRSHTSAILLDAEYLIAYLSRFMTLRTGTLIGLGSAGWDGQSDTLPETPGARQTCEFEVEEYGRLRLELVRRGALDQPRRSPLLAQREQEGLPALPGEGERSAPALWMARGNCRDATTIDNVPEGVGMCPFLLPSSALGDEKGPIIIPPHAGDIDCAVHLAAVIGEVAYDTPREEALRHLRGVAPLLVLHDRSLGDRVPNPTDYEARPAHMMGYYADGFVRLGPVVPVSALGDWRALAMSVFQQRDGSSSSGPVQSRSADYRYDLPHMIAMLTRSITLLPGDILSLGRAGAMLRLPAGERLPAGARLGARIEGLGEILVPVDDRRDPEAQRDNPDLLFPTR